MTMLMTVDVGNSRCKAGVFDLHARPATGLPVCLRSIVVPVTEPLPWDVLRSWPECVSGLVAGLVAGSNPLGVARVLAEWPPEWPAPRHVQSVIDLPVVVQLPEPDRVGIDRVLNAVAVSRLREPGQAVVIVDCGTATTVDLVDEAGAFRGGAILPGFELAARSLHQYTAKLPFVPMEELLREPHEPLGINTRAALRSGLFWGQVGAVRELCGRLAPRTEDSRLAEQAVPIAETLIVLTGGGGELLHAELPGTRHEPHLSLQGLALCP